MTRRDYLFLAACFRPLVNDPLLNSSVKSGVALAARRMGQELAQHNPSFDMTLFLRNAGVSLT